jgi:hypothetical protein
MTLDGVPKLQPLLGWPSQGPARHLSGEVDLRANRLEVVPCDGDVVTRAYPPVLSIASIRSGYDVRAEA